MTPLSTLEFAAAAASVGLAVLAAAIGFGAGRERAVRGLAALFLALAISDTSSAIIVGWREWLSPAALRWLRVVNMPVAYLAGPLLYRYVVALVPARSSSQIQVLSWHAAAFFVALVVAVANALGSLDATPIGAAVFAFFYHAWVPQGILYLCVAAWHLRASRSLLEQVSADEAALRLSWLRVLIAVIAVLWALAGIERLLVGLGGQQWQWVRAMTGCLMTGALYFLAWFGLRQRILLPAGLAESPALSDNAARSRYARSGLGEAELAQIADDLSRLMTEQRLYTDDSLDLKTLSERSGWSPNYISQALNQRLRRNFFEFVNGFRVAAAERCLADPAEHRSIVDIAMDCGFGSKSTFNTVFKRMTGVTPSEFRRSRVQAGPASSEPARSGG